MDLVSVPTNSSNSPISLTSDYSIHESITLFGHKIAPAVPKPLVSLHSHSSSNIPQKRKRIVSDDVNIDDSNPVEETIPIIDKPSTSIKRHKFKKTNSISFEKQCSYLKHIPQRVFPKGYVRGAMNSYWLVQSRCCFNGYMSILNDVRDLLPPSFFSKIKTLGFDQFLQSVDLNVNSYHLDDLVGRYIGNYQFHLKDKIVMVSPKDVRYIFSLPFSGSIIQVARKDDIHYATPLWRKYFNVKQVTSAMVNDVFKSVVQSMNYEEENINDICRLWFCLLCSCFLTPTSKIMIPLKLFHYLERLEDIPSLNWSQYIFDQIFSNMKCVSYSVRRREKIGDRVGEYIHGYTFFVNVFL